MEKKSRILMITAALLPLFLFVFPLWNITLEAPQYPTPLGMNIHINDFSDMHPHDIKNINLMNHYVGMKYIPEAIPEFKIFPAGIIITSLLGLLIGWRGNYKWFLGWFILMVVLSCAGLYDFYLWEYDYGHDLDPKAIMKFTNPDGSVMGFQPPLFGSKDILNFTAHSYPQLGAYFLGMGIMLSLFAFLFAKRKIAKSVPQMSNKLAVLFIFIPILFSCDSQPKPIEYGMDGCHFCQMTIVDKIHAAELITKKGKVFKFDAIECLVNYQKELDKNEIKHYLANHYTNPEELIDATKATFLISENIPSPMGAYLTAFDGAENAKKIQSEKGGDLYTWNELLSHL